MSHEVEFVLSDTGWKRREIATKEVPIDQTLIDALGAVVKRRASRIMPMSIIDNDSKSFIGMSLLGGNQAVFTMPIEKMNLTAPFAVNKKEERFYPAFDSHEVVMPMIWVPPAGMKLSLMVIVSAGFACSTQYLVATDNEMRLWRLPLSNLYQECRLCSGTFTGTSDSYSGALALALNQFKKSNWNSDLYTDASDARRAATYELFSYKVNGDQFIQQAPKGAWSTYCEKVSNEFISSNIVL